VLLALPGPRSAVFGRCYAGEFSPYPLRFQAVSQSFYSEALAQRAELFLLAVWSKLDRRERVWANYLIGARNDWAVVYTDGKRQEILIEASTGIRRMAALADPNSTSPPKLQALQDAARARGIELSIHRVSKPEEIASAIDAAKNSGAEALNVLASAFLFNTRHIILPHVAALRLPAIYQWPEITEEGGLMGYGPHLVQIYGEIWSRQLAQLLRGTKPADIPIEQPTKFDLAVNLKTAKSLGVTFSESFLQRADKVIE
jgi:hypothetical protein